MQNRILYTLLGLVAAILVVRASVFTVSEDSSPSSRSAVRSQRQFRPGLHFRIPWSKKPALRQAPHHPAVPAGAFLTREQEQPRWTHVKWRIDNLRRFYEATSSTEEVANDRLGETIKDSIKTVVTQHAAAGVTAIE
jgi:membrane protease subunit HflC